MMIMCIFVSSNNNNYANGTTIKRFFKIYVQDVFR